MVSQRTRHEILWALRSQTSKNWNGNDFIRGCCKIPTLVSPLIQNERVWSPKEFRECTDSFFISRTFRKAEKSGGFLISLALVNKNWTRILFFSSVKIRLLYNAMLLLLLLLLSCLADWIVSGVSRLSSLLVCCLCSFGIDNHSSSDIMAIKPNKESI